MRPGVNEEVVCAVGQSEQAKACKLGKDRRLHVLAQRTRGGNIHNRRGQRSQRCEYSSGIRRSQHMHSVIP